MSDNRYTIDQVEPGILEIVRTQVKTAETISPDTELASVGVDSLAMVRILVAIEAEYGVWLEGDELGPDFLKNVSAMAHAVITLHSKGSAP